MAFNTATANVPAKRSAWLNPSLIIPLVLVVFLAVIGFSNYIKYNNLGVTSENAIDAQYQSNENNLGQLVLKVKEALGIAKLNNAELDKVLKGAVQGRYGEGGAQQAMLWVKENYPGRYDPKLFVNVQQTVLAGRTDFETKQNLLIDKVRVYKNLTEFVWSGTWLKIAGFPRSTFDWNKYKPVLAEGTQKTFDTHVDTGIEIK